MTIAHFIVFPPYKLNYSVSDIHNNIDPSVQKPESFRFEASRDALGQLKTEPLIAKDLKPSGLSWEPTVPRTNAITLLQPKPKVRRHLFFGCHGYRMPDSITSALPLARAAL
jgi:hypothetical protein